VLTSKRQELYV